MGDHRGRGSVRGVSKGPLIAVGLTILLVLAVVGWFQLRDRISDQGAAAAGACVEGDSVLAVAVDPDIAPQIEDLAAQYAETAPVVRDHCVSVTVTPIESDTVRDALTGEWDENLGPHPALWIPSSSHSLRQLPAPSMIDGEPRSLATSPVVLATRTELAAALESASTQWQDLPSLQSGRSELDALELSGWGGLKLALPTGPGSPATEMAVESVAVPAAGAGAGPVTVEQARSRPVRAAVAALSSSYQATVEDKPASTAAALTALVEQDDAAGAELHAVPATEQQVYRTLRDSPGAQIAAFIPAGATPVADHPAAILSGPAVDETQARAAAQFVDFIHQPEQTHVFVDAGFRTDTATPADDTALTFPGIETTLIPADAVTATELIQVVENPISDRNSTILLDLSSSMASKEGSRTRLENTAAALTAHLERVPDTSNLGVWVYSKDLDGTRPFKALVLTGRLADGGFPEGTRQQAIGAALGGVRPATGSSTYASVQAAYESAVAGYVPGRVNSVLLITDGANDDAAIARSDLLTAIAAATDPARPVRIDILTIGENPDLNTLQAMADRTGGSLIEVDSSDGPDGAAAITKLLS